MTDGIISLPLCPLFLEAREGSERSDEVLYGSAVTVLDERDGWLRLRTRYRYEGFARPGVLEGGDVSRWEEEARQVVIRPFADVMDRPAYRATVLLSLPRGAILAGGVPVEDGQWLEVRLVDGRRGFVRTEALREQRLWNEEGQEKTRDHLIADALAYLGTAYRWGGKTPMGIDCSGLCFMAYQLNGLAIYRDAVIREGFPVRPIAPEGAERGDLIYWPGHVGLYLGGGRYVHSTGKSGGTLVNSLRPDDDDYREDLAQSISSWGSVF
jgi:hypothetical protein